MTTELEGNSTLSHYRIVAKIGAGGMGEVYLAEDTKLDRRVALKILPREFADDRDRMNRFVREAKSASGLNHPNIITIHEIGETDGTHFIAAEYIQGETLHTRLIQGRLDLKTTLDIAIQVASALNAAHKAGITHRDIKPENLMVRPDGLVKILDFGIAKLLANKAGPTDEEAATALKPQGTSPGVIIGTANYMSPEQARGKDVGAQSDIFSFGIVLYEMVTGQRAFTGDNALDVIGAILHKEPTPLNQLSPDLPHDIARIINKTLRKDPEARYQTAGDLLTDLKDAKQELEFQDKLERTVAPQSERPRTQAIVPSSTEAQAVPTSSAEFITQEVKKHKIGVLIGALFVLALLIGGFWFVYRRASTGDATISSIAVLPFQNRSTDTDTEYLSDGLAESLIYRLSQLPNLKVSPTSAVMRYKGKELDAQRIASELGVQAVMFGRMIQRGENLSISVELIDAANNKIIWGEQYERKMSDLLATQREIAAAVTQKLQLKLSGDETKGLTKRYTQDNEAYQLYLKGRFYWNKRTAEGLKTALEQFRAASEKDPSFALAYVGMADSYLVGLYNTRGKEKEAIPMAKAYAAKALEIDPSLAEAHATMGLVSTFLWEWAEAETHFKRSIELNPNYPSARHWYSRLLRPQGRFDEAFEQITQAKKADELSVSISTNVAENRFEKGDIQGSIEEARRGMEISPAWTLYRTLAHCYLRLDRKEDALANAKKSVELLNGAPALKVLGYVQGAIGNRSQAIAIARELEAKFKTGEAEGRDVAVVYAGLGENDKVFEWLEKDFQNRSSSIVELRSEVPFMPLRNDPRFKNLLRRMGLPE